MDKIRMEPTRQFSNPPEVSHLRRQAKRLLKTFTAGEDFAVAEVNTHCPGETPASFTLATAQRVIARAHGFDSWSLIIAEVERRHPIVVSFVKAVHADNVRAVKRLFNESQLLRSRINDPWFDEGRTALMCAIACNSKAMIDLLLDAGADPNAESVGQEVPIRPVQIASPELAEHLRARGAIYKDG
ncbi:MAG: ankyrin repeat domain-containing protein [Verrucomicrobia bacterium]|nr:ankyrin repeat domain-containing protein [Verrucomicrobiota bacterium]